MEERSLNVSASRPKRDVLVRIESRTRRTSAVLLLPCLVALWGGEARADEVGVRCAETAERGQRDRDSAKLLDALVAFTQCSSEVCPTFVREECLVWQKQTNEAAPRLRVSVNGEGRLYLDGQPVAPAEAAAPMLLDPGDHTVSLQDGERRTERKIYVTVGSTTNVALSLADDAGAAQAAGQAARKGDVGTRGWGFWVAPATAALAFGVSAGLGASALSDYGELSSRCPSCAQGDINGMQTKAVVADVALTVGVLTLAYFGWTLLRHDASPKVAVVRF